MPANGTMTVNYSYDSQGALAVAGISRAAETWASGTSNTFTYTLDALERPTQMTDSSHNDVGVRGDLQCGEPTAVRRHGDADLQQPDADDEHRGERVEHDLQLLGDQNNGQIASSVDGISGETVTYTYDALKRLSRRVTATWSAGYTYDGYGNLLGIAGNNGAALD